MRKCALQTAQDSIRAGSPTVTNTAKALPYCMCSECLSFCRLDNKGGDRIKSGDSSHIRHGSMAYCLMVLKRLAPVHCLQCVQNAAEAWGRQLTRADPLGPGQVRACRSRLSILVVDA